MFGFLGFLAKDFTSISVHNDAYSWENLALACKSSTVRTFKSHGGRLELKILKMRTSMSPNPQGFTIAECGSSTTCGKKKSFSLRIGLPNESKYLLSLSSSIFHFFSFLWCFSIQILSCNLQMWNITCYVLGNCKTHLWWFDPVETSKSLFAQ